MLFRRDNPYYLAVAILGFAFAVTALVYTAMTFRALRSGEAYTAAETDGGLMRIMRRHGGTILGGEVALLAVAAVAAMARDTRITARQSAGDSASGDATPTGSPPDSAGNRGRDGDVDPEA